MIVMIRAIILWMIIIGYCLFLKKKYVEMAFAPILVISGISAVFLIAGILNCMLYMVCLISIGGVVLGVLSKPWQMSRQGQISNRDLAVLAFFSFLCLAFAARLQDCHGLSYDNFTHWLVVVREILDTDKLPNFMSDMIIHQGYPTGSAGFIYFICRVLGESESIVIFAQSIILAASLCVFCAFIKEINVFSIVVLLLGGTYCLIANVQITELLVDTLVPMLGIAAVAVMVFYNRDIKYAAVYSLPIQIFLITVKNSGMVFLLFDVIALVSIHFWNSYAHKVKLNFKGLIKWGGLSLLVPLAVLFLWTRHVDYVFVSGTTSKHSMTIENYASVLGDKTTEEIEAILKVFLEKFFSVNEGIFVCCAAVCIVLITYFAGRYHSKKSRRMEPFICIGIIFAYLGFMTILAIMYLVSMPYSEAIILASYERYEKQILIWIIGIVMIYLLQWRGMIEFGLRSKMAGTLIIAAFGCLLITDLTNLSNLFLKTDVYSEEPRATIEQIKDTYDLPEGSSYFIYGAPIEDDAGYTYFLGRYIFWSTDIKACSPSQLSECKDEIGDYEYVIILEEDPQINELLAVQEIKPCKIEY